MKWTPRLMMAAVFVLSIVMVASSAMAQPGGGGGRGGRGGGQQGGQQGGRGGPGGMMGGGMRGGGGGGGVVGLLQIEVIQTDLGVSKSTAEEAQSIAREVMQGGGGFEAFRGLRELPEDERQAKMEELRAKMQELGKTAEKKVAELIGMDKFGRLKEIELQMAGVQAIARPDVAAFLDLTDEQKKELQDLRTASMEAGRSRMESVIPGGFGAMREMSEDDRRAAFEKMGALREEAQKTLEKDVMGVLTDEQKEKLGKMMGKPFAKMEELKAQTQRGFGGRGGRGGQAGQGGRGGPGQGGEGRGQRGGERGGQRGGERGGERRQRPT
jgi:LTXXQ motif family protein